MQWKKKKRETRLAKWNICDSSPLWIDIRGGKERQKSISNKTISCSVSVHPRIEDKGFRVVSGRLSFRIEEELMKLEGGREYSCWTLAGNRITAGMEACLRLKCFLSMTVYPRDWVSFAIDGTEFIVVRRVSELENNFSSKTKPACAWFHLGIEFSNGIREKEEKKRIIERRGN